MAAIPAVLDGSRLIDFNCVESDAPRIVFLCRDPGSWNAVLPVISRICDRPASAPYRPHALVSGWAGERLERDRSLVERQFAGAFIDAPFGAWKPALFVTAGGVTDHHLEVAARERFPDVPMLCIEDNYGQYGRLFDELVRRGLRLPEKVCCIDAASRDDLCAAFPAYAESGAVVTGQPAFDRLAPPSADGKAALRAKIGVEASASLVTVVGTPNVQTLVAALAEALGARDCRRVVCAFRQHPRDVTWPGLYLEAFDKAGLQLAETSGASMDDVASASDVIVSTWSTELIHAAYRAIPAVYLVDRRYVTPDPSLRFPLPPVRLGAALHAETVEDAAHLVEMLADPDPHRSVPGFLELVRGGQRRHYVGGGATRAVLSEIAALARPSVH